MEKGFIALESRMEGDPLIHPGRLRISPHVYDSEVAADRCRRLRAKTRRPCSGGWSENEAFGR
jgi:hypothetical protein